MRTFEFNTAARRVKQSLLQNLFTGKIRLKV